VLHPSHSSTCDHFWHRSFIRDSRSKGSDKERTCGSAPTDPIMASLISAIQWIPRGKAARHPARTNLSSDEEVARISALTGLHFADAQKQLEQAQKAAQGMGEANDGGWEDDEDDDEEMEGIEETGKNGKADAKMQEDDADDLSRYRLDQYDEEDQVDGPLGAFSNIKGLTFHRNNDEDPYITMKDVRVCLYSPSSMNMLTEAALPGRQRFRSLARSAGGASHRQLDHHRQDGRRHLANRGLPLLC
jgi:hypothetical protein